MISKQHKTNYADGVGRDKIKYRLNESEVLNLYYSEPRLAALMNLDVIRLIDCHLVVNLKDFITPKTNHLTAHAKRHIPDCCVGIQYTGKDEKQPHDRIMNSTLDILIQSADFPERGAPDNGAQSVTAFCIGMHLHPCLTEDLLRKAGIVPKATQQDGAYRYLYTVLYKGTIEDCNVYLRSQKLQEFKLREKSA